MYIPDGLLTSGFLKHDVEPNPHIIAPDPLASDDCLDVFSPVYQLLPLEPQELNTMNPSEDEPSSGLNGRLRPRKSAIPSPLSIKQVAPKLDGKNAQEKPKRSSTPSKASPSKPEDLSSDSILLPSPQLLCPYCDRKFGSKQNVSKHIRRSHLSASKIESSIVCLFCNHDESEPSDIIRHMTDSHPNQYFACLDCHTRFLSTKELAEHKINICEKQKLPYRNKLRRKTTKKSQKDSHDKDDFSSKNFSGHGFNGIVISCELKPTHIHDEADIEDNITTNLILPPSKNISPSAVLEKNAVIVLDDIQWNRRIPSNFSFHNTDADQILSRLGVVHRSPKTGESTKKDWFRAIEDATQKFEKCFDTSFYSKVASNVHENLTKFLDGSFNFNPDPDSTIKTRKSKNSVVINTAEGFPILLACEQYSRNTYDGYIPRTIAPKHKWKWDNLENEKPWNPDQIKRDTHANNCIITLVSSLDIWTQLRMRRKYEDKFNITPVEKKTEKQKVISNELKEILESREIPATSSQITKFVNTPSSIPNVQDFPSSLGLMPTAPNFNLKPAILSGEWVRPRCYVCCACGAQSRDSRALSIHVSSKHPNAQVQHYEIVGESLLKENILKHLYVPPNQNMNRTRPPRGFRDCTKCMKSITIEDLHQHMLDCAGDTPAVRRKCRYRPFGVRRRRPRLPDNRIRKKMRNDIRTRSTRSKSRMRPKQKLRSEVGDAETIRKMLADLPAKRHRVLVNPLNSILRPRRKLDKQRAMLMMKRHASDDLKIGKPKASTAMHFDHQHISTNTDRYKNATNRDDEDNEPLKSRLKRVACKITRQKESLNRKVILKKTKRKVRLLAEKKENEGVDKEFDVPPCGPVKVQTNELSTDNNNKKINLSSGPQDTEQKPSGQGNPNNDRGDNQRPGGNNEEDNSQDHPAPDIPLKHSIARLTARSETHDKSVQFHQLFLVQQECNNTNAHVPGFRRVFFEDEGVILNVDKPPLRYHYKNSAESTREHAAEPIPESNSEPISGQIVDSVQKNKLNKPRKGLNDCIAMLKNKLVDSDPNAPAHVSVQCGTDDLLNPDPLLTCNPTLISPRVDMVMKPVQISPNTEQPKKLYPKSVVPNEPLPKPAPLYRRQYFNHDMYGHINNERPISQWRPVNYDAIMPRYVDNNRTRKESSRRRSTSQHDSLFYAQQLLRVTPPSDDMLLKLSSESYNAYNLPPLKSPKKYSGSFGVDNNKALTKFGKRKVNEKIHAEPSNGAAQTCSKITNNADRTRKSFDSTKRSTRSRASTPRKPPETFEKHINIGKDVAKSTKDPIDKYRKKSLDGLPQRDLSVNNLGMRTGDIYPQIIRTKRNSNLSAEVNLSHLKQAEMKSNVDANVQMLVKVFNEHNRSNQVSIPLAHASTKIESMLSLPLDLSSKTLPAELDYSCINDSILLANYDRYETLDLSNKRRSRIGRIHEDEVVDLRVKHNYEYPRLDTVKVTCPLTPQKELNTVTPINLIHHNECEPTDLSLKRIEKAENVCLNLCQKINVDEGQIQDLSKNKTTSISTVDQVLLTNEEIPTDLSNKKATDIVDITMAVKEPNKQDLYESLPMCSDRREQNDLSGKENHKQHIHEDTKIITANDQMPTEAINTETSENIVHENESQVTVETSLADDALSQNQKPIYDPTLRIPQYKIRPTESELASSESNDTDAPIFTTISTCVESYSPHLNSIDTSHSTSTSQNSTAVNNSMIASIEVQERITYSFTKSILNSSVTSVTGSLPTYSLPSRGITTPFTTFESTRPVYTLPSSCISMTKIDVAANSLLSIPSTTIMGTSPVYTLAGTSLATPLNYVTLPSTGQSIPFPPPCTNYLPDTHSSIVQEGRSYDNIFVRGAMFNFERDYETSRYFFSLPQDIVAIIKTMPADLRNNLLDALLQHLSTTRPIPILTSHTPLFPIAGPSILTKPIRHSREFTVDASTDTVDIKPLCSLETIKDEQRLQRNVDSHIVVQNSDLVLDEVIDLTYDEVIPKSDADKDMNDEQQMLPVEEIPPIVASISNTPKVNNEKTASLRAVRIKAPSERQQLKIIVNPIENLPIPEIPIAPVEENNFENEFIQSLHAAGTLSDIQMYEVSSTQSNRNKMSDMELLCKPLLIPVSENLPVSKIDVVVKENVEDLQPQLVKQDTVETLPTENNLVTHETDNSALVSQQINLNNNANVDNNLENRSMESDKKDVTESVPKIDELLSNHLSGLENDDDSDDNISLAVIVKQKQQNQNKLKQSQLDNETQLFASCSNANEKGKRHNRNKETNKIMSIETLISETKETPSHKDEEEKKVLENANGNDNDPILDSDNQIWEKGIEMITKQIKKKGKKRYSDASSKNVKILDKKEIKSVEHGENDPTFENIKKKKENTSKSNDNRDLVIPSVETITIVCNKDVEVPENVDYQNNTINKHTDDVLEESKDIDNNEMKFIIIDTEYNCEKKDELKVIQNDDLLHEVRNQEEIQNINGLSSVEETAININTIDKVDTNESLGDVTNNLQIDNTPQPSNAMITFNEEDEELPLRRSKRGKSLFVESNEQTLTYSDSFSEQKAPLTKKQLIFSKLLLDEEKNLKFSSLDNQMLLSEKSLDQPDESKKGFEEKNKPVKRKKSSHSKKKSKKKKSIHDIEHLISNDDVPKVNQDCNLNAVEQYEKLNPTLNSNIELDCEVITQQRHTIETDNNNEMASSNISTVVEQNKVSMPESIVKRKIELCINTDLESSTHSSKPKKTKLNNVNDNFITLHSDTIASDNCNTSHNLPLAARRARSKSVVVKSSGSMLYDPYDIDFEDMGDKTEPFRKQSLTLLRAGSYKSSKENDIQTYTTAESVTHIQPEIICNAINTDIAAKESISDSDESSKSDVPLKKYVEEKERKNLLYESGNNKPIYHNTNDEDLERHDNEIKQTRKKHKKNKRSLPVIDNVQENAKDDKEVSEEQLRSEQFMESFGFFSERKPRKSNLLATKKISETFHIIANESDDIYFGTKEKPSKKTSRSENKRTVEDDTTKCYKNSDAPKLSTKYDKNLRIRSATLYCHVCKKEFRRTDNLVRHQLSLSHASKLSESSLQLKSAPVREDLNYLIVFREHMDRLRILEHKMKNKKNAKSKFTFPTLHEILLEVRKSVREQQLARRNLSRDQALFLDCCELLKDSNRGQIEERDINTPFFPCCPSSYALACTNTKEYDPHSGLSFEFSRYGKPVSISSNLIKKPIIHTSARLSGMADFVLFSSTSKQVNNTDIYGQPSTSTTGLQGSNNLTRVTKPDITEDIIDEKDESKSDGDVDSITAQNILESEEVKNLENDLLSGLKQADCKFQPLLTEEKIIPSIEDSCPLKETDISLKKETTSKIKSVSDTKERKNLDIIENIDIFEDKFDKIKRKCRSQAAAAKHLQTAVEPSTSHKSRKKSDRKKGKRNSKKHNQNTVLTKGALKGYDSIKVSILTSDIDMSSIVPPIATSSKKKKKRSSKKKRDKKNSMLTRKLDSNSSKESHKDIDVYEFLDNDEPEIFELRPSTVMERFRNLNKKEVESTTKETRNDDEIISSDSISDGDDFVYMSDDYVCSDDETENSLMSCEFGNVKGGSEVKKSFSPLKRKDVMEKNAVMGKIFKHAVRSDKKSIKPKETIKPKANLDQLFDSLLEEEPNSSMLMNDTEFSKRDSQTEKKRVFSPIVLSKYDLKTTKNNDVSSKTNRSPSPALSSDSTISRRVSSFSSRHSSPRRLSSNRYDISSPFDYEPSTSKGYDDSKKYDRISKDYEFTKKLNISEKKYDVSSPKNIKIHDDSGLSPKSDKFNIYEKPAKDKTHSKKEKVADYGTGYDYRADYYDEDAFSDDAGVARQRARRKCTVGKQNVLAETWSSESELDGMPPRPNSAESVVLSAARKRKGRKREGQICGGRKGNKHVSVKKQDFGSRVSSSNRNTGANNNVAGTSRSSGSSSAYTQQLSLPGPSGIGPRLRPTTSFWADGDEEQEHVQQHGWIVGDSHKKLVTMLAHAKGRKRNNDDKVRLME